MTGRVLLFLLSLTLLGPASVAHAVWPGVNLRWNECFGDGGAQNLNFACNTNVGTRSLRGSFVLGNPVEASSVEAVVDVVTASPVLPEWWEFQVPGSCRTSSLTIAAFEGTNCLDWAQGQALMFINSYGPNFYPNWARIRMSGAMVTQPLPNLAAGVEYAAFSLRINNAATVDSPCTGCEVPACIVFTDMVVDPTDPAQVQHLFGPTDLAGSSFWATWQGGGGVTIPPGRQGCPGVVPTRRSTWGAVKGMYR